MKQGSPISFFVGFPKISFGEKTTTAKNKNVSTSLVLSDNNFLLFWLGYGGTGN